MCVCLSCDFEVYTDIPGNPEAKYLVCFEKLDSGDDCEKRYLAGNKEGNKGTLTS